MVSVHKIDLWWQGQEEQNGFSDIITCCEVKRTRFILETTVCKAFNMGLYFCFILTRVKTAATDTVPVSRIQQIRNYSERAVSSV